LKKPFYKRWWFIVLVVIVIIGAIGSGGEDADLDTAKQAIVNVDNETKETESVKEKIEEPVKKEVVEISNETLSQKNAVKMAETYLKTIAFSKSGLVKQLEFEGFSNEDATYAVNKISVDWKEQAVKSAKVYLDTMAFSRSGLIEQLEFEGFSNEEATYAVDEIGL